MGPEGLICTSSKDLCKPVLKRESGRCLSVRHVVRMRSSRAPQTTGGDLCTEPSCLQELQRLKRQAEILKGEVDRLKAAKERNEARERELMSSVQDYGEYIRMMSLVKTETEKKVLFFLPV